MGNMANRFKVLSVFEVILFISLIAVSARIFVTPYMALATVSYGLIFAGFLYRKIDSKKHGIFMAGGVIGDLSLVLILELQRNAIDTAMSFKLTPLQQSHIFCSSVAAALYFPLMIMGLLIYNRPQFRNKLYKMHGFLGTIAFIFRSLGFLLMFSMLGLKH